MQSIQSSRRSSSRRRSKVLTLDDL
jgi:hypothetical protein